MMQLADDTQRTSIVGRTGSGKTAAAVWHLSESNYRHMPWVIYDFKQDQLLAELGALDGAEHIGLDTVPRKPGLYFVHPLPHETEAVQEQLWKIWAQESTGVYIDEGYMMATPPKVNPAFRSLLTQGRSKRIPMIILSQRPVWLDRFVFSESDFYQVFALNHSGDRKTMMEYIPADLNKRLPEYWSYYHDVSAAETVVCKPVPFGPEVIESVARGLASLKKKRTRVLV